MNNTLWDTICDLADDIVEVLILNQPHSNVSLGSHYIKIRDSRIHEEIDICTRYSTIYVCACVLGNKFSE